MRVKGKERKRQVRKDLLKGAWCISERVPCACITAHRVLLLRELFPYLPASSQPDDVLTTVCRTYYFVAGEIVFVGRE